MKIAIGHYHLNRGGVTRVIANHLKALNCTHSTTEPPLKVALLFGGRSEDWPIELIGELQSLDVSFHPVEELDYDGIRYGHGDLAAQLKSTLENAGFRSQETVLHFHNHSLGKNTDLPLAVAELAQTGYACLLQIHDFAEDFRPQHYQQLASKVCDDKFEQLPAILYPQASQVHYAVLSGRDHSILREAGVHKTRLHLLPNSITEFGSNPERDMVREELARRFGIPTDDRLFVYPVRGIRRKNLGEALLWSALADKKTSFALTLAPLNPEECQSYEQWKEFAKQLDLKWHFDVGGKNGMEFQEILSASDVILTTSVCEGFGMVFLEAWLAGRQLVGRDLPAITGDFEDMGLRFPGLEPGLLIPVDWIGQGKLCCAVIESFKNVLSSFGRATPTDKDLRSEFDHLITDGLIDFAICNTGFQRQIVERLVRGQCDRNRILEINPSIGLSLKHRASDQSLISHNGDIIRREYSLDQCGNRLQGIYQRLVSSAREKMLQPPAHGNRVLESFLDLSRFQPLRVER